MWCPLRNEFTQVSASCSVLCNNIVTLDSLHRNKVKYDKLLLFHYWKIIISLNIETVAVIANIKGQVNVIPVFICILIFTQNTSENKHWEKIFYWTWGQAGSLYVWKPLCCTDLMSCYCMRCNVTGRSLILYLWHSLGLVNLPVTVLVLTGLLA